MLKRLTIITGLMFLASVVYAEVLDKASTFTVEQDSITGNWKLECSSEVVGIYRSLDHNVGADLRIADGSGSIQIFNLTTNFLAGENRLVRTVDRTDFEIKKTGTRLKVSVDVADYYPAGTGDRFICGINIGKGLSPSEKGDTLYGVRMEQSLQDIGTP